MHIQNQIDTLSDKQQQRLKQLLIDAQPHQATPKHEQLVAYVTTTQANGNLDHQALIEDVSRTLPAHMVPQRIVQIENFPTNSNGKIDRQALARKIIPRTTSTPAPASPSNNPHSLQLIEIWQNTLNVPSIDIHDNFFALGGDSILAIQVIGKARRAGIQLSVSQLFNQPTIAQLIPQAHESLPLPSNNAPITGSVPLTPIQHWFFEQNFTNPNHWNQSILIEIPASLDHVHIETSIRQLCQHHDALRLSFQHTAGAGWQQINTNWDERKCLLERIQVESESIETISHRLNASIHIGSGCLLKAALLESKNSGCLQLLLCIHHLAVDAFSWNILLEDLETLLRKEPLPDKTTSFKTWANTLTDYAQSESMHSELSVWSAQKFENAPQMIHDLDSDIIASETTSHSYQSELNAEETNSISKCAQTHTVSIQHILISALSRALHDWKQIDHICIGIEGHGRENLDAQIDLSRTVGWCASFYPYTLRHQSTGNESEQLFRISKELNALQHSGITYGIARYLRHQSPEETKPYQGSPQIIFNYLGKRIVEPKAHTLLKVKESNLPGSRDNNAHLTSQLEINATIINGKLSIRWAYSQNQFKASTIEQLALHFERSLQSISTSKHSATDKATEGLQDTSGLDSDDLNTLFGQLN